MKMVSWNVNGIRACMTKGFMDFFQEIDADIFCIQETKMQPGQLDIATPGYYQYINSADKKGYSGTMVFTKEKPIAVTMIWVLMNMIMKDVSLPVNMKTFIWFVCIHPILKMVYCVWTIVCNGKMISAHI